MKIVTGFCRVQLTMAYERDLAKISVDKRMSLWQADETTFNNLEESISQESKTDRRDIIVYSESEKML